MKYTTVIFDVDDTLYDLRKVKIAFLATLIRKVLSGATSWHEFRVVAHYRKCRDTLPVEPGFGLDELQYVKTASFFGIPEKNVRGIVNKYMHEWPLPFVGRYKIDGVGEFFHQLHRQNVKIGAVSEYPPMKKLNAMGLKVDKGITTTSPEYDCLKPHPAALASMVDLLGGKVEKTLYVGDKIEKDYECARAVGVDFALMDHRDKFVEKEMPGMVVVTSFKQLSALLGIKSKSENEENV